MANFFKVNSINGAVVITTEWSKKHQGYLILVASAQNLNLVDNQVVVRVPYTTKETQAQTTIEYKGRTYFYSCFLYPDLYADDDSRLDFTKHNYLAQINLAENKDGFITVKGINTNYAPCYEQDSITGEITPLELYNAYLEAKRAEKQANYDTLLDKLCN